MASESGTSERPDSLCLEIDSPSNVDRELKETFQGPHEWRKHLRPVQSPIKSESPELKDSTVVADGNDKENVEEKQKDKTRPLPPWKRDLIERNKKVARLVRRESSGRSKKTSLVRRESSGKSKRPTGNESPSVVQRKRSFHRSSESTFTQQVVNEGNGTSLQVPRKRISPANSFKTPSSPNVRRTPSDKVDPNDPNIKKRVERVRRARLYLLQQMGPNSFCIVGDSPEHKFRVIIGPQTCSCAKGPHCVHVLFVMLRVFRVTENDPCLWNKQLKNYEVENLFRAYHSKRTLRIEKKVVRKPRKQSPDQSAYPSTEESRAPSESDTASVREEDDTCPICLLEMLEGESLLKCDHCQNRLHHHCITVWFDECRRQNEALICPLCRSKWKNTNVEVKTDGDDEVSATPQHGPTLVPPNTRAPSPQLDLAGRLPYAEPIPEEYTQISQPWLEVLGSDLVSCLFSRNWSIRETGLKHLGKEMTRELVQVAMEGKSGMSPAKQASMIRLLECCCSVLALMCNDPVYRVYVGCLKVLRSVLSHTPSRTDDQRSQLQALFKPVIDTIIIKCTDGNRKMSQLSLSTMNELAKNQHGELALGREIANPGRLGLGGISYLLQLVTESFETNMVTWQWLLGRLYVIENLLVDFPTEFIPRMSPDGASSDGSLELMGATSFEEDGQPQLYERLLVIAEFAAKAVTFNHTRICRKAKRVFLLTARYAAHLENLSNELMELLSDLDFVHRKSLKRQFEKILNDYHLSDKIVHELRPHDSPIAVSPADTPVSTPRCNSPVTTVSDHHSDAGSFSGRNTIPVPPNTPIRDRRKEWKSYEIQHRSFDFLEEENSDSDSQGGKPMRKISKSLDDLDSINRPKRSKKRYSKSPGKKSNRSRSRSKTPQRIGPVLETNIDDVIRQQEESKKIDSSIRSLTYGGDDTVLSEDISMLSSRSFVNPDDFDSFSKGLPTTPSPRLLSHDLETDIDSVELDLKALTTANISRSEKSANSSTLTKKVFPASVNHSTPNTSPKVPTSLSLNLNFVDESPRSISPCAHVKELERLSVKPTQVPDNSDTQSIKTTPCSLVSKKLMLTIKNGKHSRSDSPDVNDVKKSPVEATGKLSQLPAANQKSQPSLTDDLLEVSPIARSNEKPVTFKTEVAMGTPKHSPSQTLDKDDDDCPCKEEVEKEEAIALAKAMEISSQDPPKPIVPGLTPMDTEEVITIRIQPDNCNENDTDCNANPPTLYYENVHWVKGPLLGTGAFSSCYQARDVKTGTIMALKQISFCRNSKSEQDTVIKSVTEEIHMMSKLSHPNIIRIMGATRQGCHFNMFVEWMPGGSVSYLLGQYGRFSEDVITSYMLQILRGLAYLHDSQILHRDLKGANLLADSTGQRLRICDFGAAARLASKATVAGEFQGQLLGTIAFMAPEVLRGENYGRACDVWSCGCCMIEMATTKPPWNAHDISNHLALIFKIANANSTPPIPDNLSPPQRDVLLRCLETVKEQRPTAKELLIHPLFTQYMIIS